MHILQADRLNVSFGMLKPLEESPLTIAQIRTLCGEVSSFS